MSEINRKRWMKLAGIISESSYHMAVNDQIASVVEKHVTEMLRELGVDSKSGELIFDDLFHTTKRYLTAAMAKAGTKMRQEQRMAPGTNDSVEGPYKKVADKQPMGVSKQTNKHLVEVDEPEDRWPAREDEEEARAEHCDVGSDYPLSSVDSSEEEMEDDISWLRDLD